MVKPPDALARSPLARRWLHRLGWALSALILIWGLMWLALPPLIKWQLQKQGSAALGRTVTLERVQVRPWALRFTLVGLRVANAAGDAPQFSFERLFFDLELQSLLRLAPVVDALRLEAPRLSLRHLGSGRLDIDDIVQRLTPPPSSEPSPPARFSLFNIELEDGAVEFVDEPVGVTHRLEALHVAVPFLSNLGSRREVQTEPRLAFRLNGSAFDTRATTTPFAEDRQTRARLQIPDLDVQPYLVYWPATMPVKLDAARLHLDLTLDFEQHTQPALAISGEVGVSGVRASEGGQPFLAWERLDISLRRLEPLRQRAEIARVRLGGPQLELSRNAQGALNLPRVQPPSDADSGGTAAPSAVSTSASPWQVVVDEVALADGSVRWRDAAVQPVADLALSALQARATGITWPVRQAVPVEIDAQLGNTPLSVRASATEREAQASVSLGELPLSMAAPYVAQYLVPPLDASLQGDLTLDWRAATGTEPGVLRIEATKARLAALRLGTARAPLARLQQLDVTGAQVDLIGRQVNVARIELLAPDLAVSRGADGRWMFDDWLRRAAQAAAPPAETPGGASDAAWGLVLADVQLNEGRVRFTDETTPQPVALIVQGLSARVQNLQPLAERAPQAPLQVRFRVAAPGAASAAGAAGQAPAIARDAGRVALDGNLQLPGRGVGAGLRGRLQVERLPLHAFVPYAAERLNLELLRADASVRGDLAFSMAEAGPTVELAMDAALEDLRAHSLAPSEELLTWSSLQLRGLRVRSAPGQAASVQVDETVLSDYFARVVIDEQGRINLQGLLKPAPETGAVASGGADSAPAPDIRVGPISLVNGQVRFSDRFIRPNYTANLSDLTGSLSAFSSTPPAPGQPLALADLSLKGRAEGTAQLDISGQINPLATPLAMDIKAQVRDLELPPLSPYSAKYAGYGIERGKLSVDVRYRIEPDGKLEASNQIVLNQLSFGERDSNSTANLPVKLAVALLADRNGVIDINLPVSGSLNDPQFRLGPIIVRLIFNLIGKAITAPFSLIASAFAGGGADASQLEFEAGRALLDDADRRQLEAVAKALENRPALRLTIVGHADLQAERSGWQRARLDALLQAEKRRRLARAGAAVAPDVRVEPAERDELLREAYRRADIPKPRNLIGIARDLPPQEMEALLLAAQVPGDEAMRELAVARAVAVKDFLLGLKLGEDRVFLGAPRTGSDGGDAARPRAELQLAPR
ncbi:DUF748 domain-containing protein [Hydrogenophaga intermedia]|uniref:DUF748 domain-containing protein n=1 Tax=Hydrogenophaga intermedia TaxID=65786 RepID=UPI00204383B1|nr:DUF748 domain-containing protein [Hydrogenophaga intermedia]MCM3563738.1 DUF748 domain-containing protein [Hydrogenophaga intermedia]